MQFTVIKPIKALNKTFRKEFVSRDEFEHFRACLNTLIAKTDENESEEHLKYPLRDFLLNTSFSDFEINTKAHTDLAIYNGDTNKTPVGVIFEIKKYGSRDFPEAENPQNINCKALHETVLYYLREREDENNDEIKQIVLTNNYEWYVFDAHDFEKAFHTNQLTKEYEKWKAGQKTSSNTAHFYNIVQQYINNTDTELECTYFDLRNYHKLPKDKEREIVPLFKILSATHLLKLNYATDSNSLNMQFYNELLYILGLEEVKKGTKKLIKRAKKTNRHSGSVLENTISAIKTENRLSKIENLKTFGDTQDEQLFNTALELTITWLNRILFLKLLEAQLIRFNKNNSDYKFLDIQIIQNFSELNELFFDVLAKQPEEREAFIKNELKNIPYLNSSLFEISRLEDKLIRINSLKDRLTIPVYKQTVLTGRNKKRMKGELPGLQYLFDFLNAYNFSNEGADEIQEESKSLINASVLGLIFEKINGYKEGSFFTPGYITMYMSRQVIRKTVVQKFKEAGYKLSENLEPSESFAELKTKIEDREEANRIINSLKIIDPAVGSGHFLVSALNEIIAIKSELGILCYRSGRLIQVYKAEVINDDLVITNKETEQIFEYNLSEKGNPIDYKQELQEAVFHEKQSIIENCLFGVDINPNSVSICRLRLWIELLKHTYYLPNNDLQTLPNIDINIKQGNSLISNFGTNGNGNGIRNGKNGLNSDPKIKQKIQLATQKYKQQVIIYKSTDDKRTKKKAEEKIAEIKEMFAGISTPKDADYKLLRKREAEYGVMPMFFSREEQETWKEKQNELWKEIQKLKQNLEEKRNTIYRNAFEWRYEFPEALDQNGTFIGFDIVMGNPPYIYNRDLEIKKRNYYKQKYQTADDLYGYFLYEGLNLLKNNGYFSFITPNTYFSLISKEKFRKTLLDYSEQKFTYSGFCFKEAYVETQILMFQKKRMNDNDILFVENPNDYKNYESYRTSKKIFKDNYLLRFFYPTSLNISIYNKIISKFSNDLNIFKETLQGKKTQQHKKSEYLNEVKPNDIVPLGLICSGEQGLVTGNNSKYIATIVTTKKEKQQIAEKFIHLYNNLTNSNFSISDFFADTEKFFQKAEEIKRNMRKPSVFGKFFNYKYIERSKVKQFNQLNKEEQLYGSQKNIWIYYHRGNSEGYKWYVPYKEALIWQKHLVQELKKGEKTNSRWQGVNYFDSTGFGWVDYFTNQLKAFYVEEGVYSKNIVKMHSDCELITDKVIVCLLNSKLLTYIIKQFITSTHTLQINDGRLIPIKIPDETIRKQFENLFNTIFNKRKENLNANVSFFEDQIDNLVYKLYGLSKEEIAAVEKYFTKDEE